MGRAAFSTSDYTNLDIITFVILFAKTFDFLPRPTLDKPDDLIINM